MSDYAPHGDPEFMPVDHMPPRKPRARPYGHALAILALSLRHGLKGPREVADELSLMAEAIRKEEGR